jgi:hypothetical protein
LHGEGLVSQPDGAFHLEAMDAHGGLTNSTPDVARFLSAYRLNGKPDAGAMIGSLPGTFTLMLMRADGVALVALFNQRADTSGLDYFAIRKLLDEAAAAVREWP